MAVHIGKVRAILGKTMAERRRHCCCNFKKVPMLHRFLTMSHLDHALHGCRLELCSFYLPCTEGSRFAQKPKLM